jgi:hypothetical protein
VNVRGYLRLRQRLRRAERGSPPLLPAGPYRSSVIPYSEPADVEHMPPAPRVPVIDVPPDSLGPHTIPADVWEAKSRSTLPSPAPEPIPCCPSCNAPLSRRG